MDKNDDDLVNVPSITLDHDDIADRRSTMPAGKTASAVTTATPASSLSRLALGLALIALLASGAGLYYLMGLLQQTQNSLVAAEARISELENKLSSTDTSITQSEEALAAKIKSIDELIEVNKSEVRKLWGVAYDRNRKAISVNTALNEEQKKSLQAATEQLAALDKQIAEGLAAMDKMSESLQNMAGKVKNSSGLVAEASQRVEFVQESIAELSDELAALESAQSNLESSLDTRLVGVEDAIKSIDVHRRNVKDELRKLKQELSKLQGATVSTGN